MLPSVSEIAKTQIHEGAAGQAASELRGCANSRLSFISNLSSDYELPNDDTKKAWARIVADTRVHPSEGVHMFALG